MRFVSIKHVEQQAVLAVHRARQGMVRARTAQANQIRGLLAEFGLIVPQGITHLYQRIILLLEEAKEELPCLFRELVHWVLSHLKVLDLQVRTDACNVHFGSNPDVCGPVRALT